MEPITHLIARYKEGDPNAEKELIAQMSPLIKKYAGKIHFMEYTDAMQELYLALLESLDYLNEAYSQAQCLKYMEVCVINRYHSLCRRALSAPEQKSIEEHEMEFCAAPGYDDSRLDVEAYIHSLPKGSLRRQIFCLFFYHDLSDAEIANRLGISRQYVNQLKRSMIRDYFQKKK